MYSSKEIIIESNVWLAAGCIISSGVTISKNSVRANSVVINNIESNCLYAGNPAIKIKGVRYKWIENLEYQEFGQIKS